MGFMNINQKIIKWRKQEEWVRFQRFLDGFKLEYLQKIIKYHHLTCADIKQLRCIYKSIRDAKLNHQQIWDAIINFGVEASQEKRK